MKISKFKNIIEISDFDAHGKEYDLYNREYKFRRAARAILQGTEGKIALMKVVSKKYHKLPGGGVKHGETIEQALHRELLEEAGVEGDIIRNLGLIFENRYNSEQSTGLLQISYCFVVKVNSEKFKINLTKSELNYGLELMWIEPNGALEVIQKDNTQDYGGKFIQIRAQALLNEYL